MFRSFAIAISILFSITLNSCESYQRDSYLGDFNHFIDKIEKKGNSFGEKDWQNADIEFKSLSEDEYEKFKNNLTEEQNSKINDLKGKYYALRIKQGIKEFGKGLKNSLEQINSAAKELAADSTLIK